MRRLRRERSTFDAGKKKAAMMDPLPQTTGEIPIAEISDEFRKSMLEFLLDRIRHQDDFPALSESIGAINRIASSDDESIATLSNLILKDFALTNKLLRLVNSTAFIQFGGGNISTVSHAVAILGFDAVKNVALSLLLFDRLKNRKHASHLKDEFMHALFSGILAREISRQAMARGIEEAFVCAMFHNLGRLLGMHYFPAEDRETRRIMARNHIGEDIASSQVLGFSYRELGMAVAQEWRFPEQIIYSMGTLPDEPVQPPESNHDKLRMLAVFSNEVCETIAHTPCENEADEIHAIISRYADGLPLTERQLLDAIDKAMAELIQYANIIQINLQKIPFGRHISQTQKDALIHNSSGCTAAPGSAENEYDDDAEPDADEDAVLDILTAGIIDISEALVAETPLNHILHAILDTLYRGLGFRHVLLCTVDGYRNVMNASFGCGMEIEKLVANFQFPLRSYSDVLPNDVFQAAVAKGEDSVIADIDHPDAHDLIPEWYRHITTAQTFALFPLNIRDVPVALIYADKVRAGTISFSEAEKRLLRTLRNQAILALKQTL